jgi:hypothetical protein
MNDPAEGAFVCTMSDTLPLTKIPRALYITASGGSGSLRVKMVNGDIVTFDDIVTGGVYPFRVQQVYLTGTTVTTVVGLY